MLKFPLPVSEPEKPNVVSKIHDVPNGDSNITSKIPKIPAPSSEKKHPVCTKKYDTPAATTRRPMIPKFPIPSPEPQQQTDLAHEQKTADSSAVSKFPVGGADDAVLGGPAAVQRAKGDDTTGPLPSVGDDISFIDDEDAYSTDTDLSEYENVHYVKAPSGQMVLSSPILFAKGSTRGIVAGSPGGSGNRKSTVGALSRIVFGKRAPSDVKSGVCPLSRGSTAPTDDVSPPPSRSAAKSTITSHSDSSKTTPSKTDDEKKPGGSTSLSDARKLFFGGAVSYPDGAESTAGSSVGKVATRLSSDIEGRSAGTGIDGDKSCVDDSSSSNIAESRVADTSVENARKRFFGGDLGRDLVVFKNERCGYYLLLPFHWSSQIFLLLTSITLED